ncbi:hypothetical protein D3C72_1829530 [compost metagenome]
MPGRRTHLPLLQAQQHLCSWLQHAIGAKTRAVLARGSVGQLRLVPVDHRLGVAGWNEGLRLRPALLQRRVTAAVIAVQVGVGQALQRGALQRRFHQRHGLFGMAAIPCIHHSRHPGSKHRVVGRQPATFDELKAGRQGNRRAR